MDKGWWILIAVAVALFLMAAFFVTVREAAPDGSGRRAATRDLESNERKKEGSNRRMAHGGAAIEHLPTLYNYLHRTAE